MSTGMLALAKDLAAILVVGILWGATNPFLNRDRDTEQSPVKKKCSPLVSLFTIFTDWKFLLPYGVNQLGSIAYVYTLANSDISMALPLCNSLAVVVTVIVSRLRGERQLDRGGLAGVLLALLGITTCIYAKTQNRSAPTLFHTETV